MTYFTWTVAVLSLVGVLLNIRKNYKCFYIWTVTNASWCLVNLYYQIYAQAALFFVYFCLAIYGLYEWKVKHEQSTS